MCSAQRTPRGHSSLCMRYWCCRMMHWVKSGRPLGHRLLRMLKQSDICQHKDLQATLHALTVQHACVHLHKRLSVRYPTALRRESRTCNGASGVGGGRGHSGRPLLLDLDARHAAPAKAPARESADSVPRSPSVMITMLRGVVCEATVHRPPCMQSGSESR